MRRDTDSCAALPSVMRRFGLAPLAHALVSLVSVPLTTDAGEWLERHVDSKQLDHEPES
ncbi:hypothetical protein OHA61_03645 [Streptomyces sp. NBC_00885]|uniref:hypothetical protein n=1 Tax=Streptomyces sp. NBC_00885 TaxID=2975857 RepID=UPI00386F644B|nr:hypothetical protein OHA61_03645 [Streptomyces sp. NBC_00885]